MDDRVFVNRVASTIFLTFQLRHPNIRAFNRSYGYFSNIVNLDTGRFVVDKGRVGFEEATNGKRCAGGS